MTWSACRARRDGLLLNHRRNVRVRCRCGNEWVVPGFDGTFTGIYLD
ncbi:hypothetical protein GCM10018790_15910 [Kitasatospora xanthocidica]|nr:hypothetical protein GCM10018790_15910 [Kitasatospora xanthocidica]